MQVVEVDNANSLNAYYGIVVIIYNEWFGFGNVCNLLILSQSTILNIVSWIYLSVSSDNSCFF